MDYSLRHSTRLDQLTSKLQPVNFRFLLNIYHYFALRVAFLKIHEGICSLLKGKYFVYLRCDNALLNKLRELFKPISRDASLLGYSGDIVFFGKFFIAL